MSKRLSVGSTLLAVVACFLLFSAMTPNRGESAESGPVAEASDDAASKGRPVGLSVGPDVTIIELSGVSDYNNSGAGSLCPAGYGDVDDSGVGSSLCHGYAIGTDSCNIGSVPVDWCDQVGGCRTTTDAWHPLAPATVSDASVIGQNMYRLKNGRFEQVGMSFLKHGFVSTNSSDSTCQWNNNGTLDSSCVSPPAGGDQLGLGCTDFYGSSLNGSRPLGRRSDVSVAGGDHPQAEGGGLTSATYNQRIVVAEEDLDPAQNSGALYWVEGHYVVRDDARAGNGLNNASYRAATVGGSPSFSVSMTGTTIRELPAIFAWQAADPAVEIVQADRNTFFVGEEADPPIAPGTFYPDYTVKERFHVARKVTTTSRGTLPYHYEYAVYNMNSETAADGFVVNFGESSQFGNVGFSDIDHHSGEPYDTADWSADANAGAGTITWSAADNGANTNALRWGTMFNFWFDSDQPPETMTHQLDLFNIDEMLLVPFAGAPGPDVVFEDGFESGDVGAWTP